MSDSLSGDQKQEGNQPVMTTTHLCIDPRPEQVFSDIAEACDNKKQEGNQSTSPTVSSQLDPGSMSVIGDGLLEGKGEGNQCSSQEVATVSQLNPGDIAHRLSEKSENQIKQGSSNAVMSRPMSDKADSLLEAFDNQKQDGNESSSWKSYAVTTHSCVAQRPYQTMSDIADGLSEVSKNQKQDGNLFTESNAVTIKQVQLQAQDTVCDSAGQPEPRPSFNVCSLWTCDSSRLDSTCGDSSSSTGSSDESSIMEKHSQHHEIGERDNEHAEADTFVPRTKGETLYQDLPPVECCDAQFPNDGRLLPVATVSHYTEKLLILCSLPNTPPIDEGTILWNKARTSIAKVFETFGPVRTPFYSIRINSVSDLPSLGITFGDEVYVIPAHPTLTKYVFPQELMKYIVCDSPMCVQIEPFVHRCDWKATTLSAIVRKQSQTPPRWRGSDASWKDDNEIPPQLQDYSDDENEKKASKRKANIRKPKNRNESSLRELRRQTGISFTEPPRLPQSASRREPVPHYPRPEVKPNPHTSMYDPGGVHAGYNPHSRPANSHASMYDPGGVHAGYNPHSGVYPFQHMGPIPPSGMLRPSHSQEVLFWHPGQRLLAPQYYQYPPANLP